MNAYRMGYDVAYVLGALLLVVFGTYVAGTIAGTHGLFTWFLGLIAVGVGLRWYL